MLSTTDRETLVKTPTAELARQIDEILDARYERPFEPSTAAPEVNRSIALVRSLIKGFGTRK